MLKREHFEGEVILQNEKKKIIHISMTPNL